MSKIQIIRQLHQLGERKIEEILRHNQEQFGSLLEKETTRNLIQEVLRHLSNDLNLEINAPSRSSSLLPLGFDILEFYSRPENQNQTLPDNLFLKNLATEAQKASAMETSLPIGHKIFKEFTKNLTNYVILDPATFSALNCKEYFEECQKAKESASQGTRLRLSKAIMSQSSLLNTHEEFHSLRSISSDIESVETSEHVTGRVIQPSTSRANVHLEEMVEEIIASVSEIPGRNPQTSAFSELKLKQLTIGGK